LSITERFEKRSTWLTAAIGRLMLCFYMVNMLSYFKRGVIFGLDLLPVNTNDHFKAAEVNAGRWLFIYKSIKVLVVIGMSFHYEGEIHVVAKHTVLPVAYQNVKFFEALFS